MKSLKRPLALLLLIVLVLISLGGCSAPDVTDSDFSPASQSDGISANPSEQNALGLSDMQYNSLNMLNHLVALMQEINTSQHDRLYLEQAYMELYDNINPESINFSTQEEITHLLNTMEKYRMIAVKRERLQYLYEQNRAQALKEIVPSPLAVLNSIQAFSLKRLVGSFIYMGADSYTRYQSASHKAETEFVQEGWKLDDEAAQALHTARIATFNYIVDIVRSEQLPGYLSLNEKAISEFVEWKNKTNNTQKIQFFESNRETYRAFGPYWLTLARCYYEAEDYEGCLEAMDEYEALGISIFRRNYELAEALPMAIVSARDLMRIEKYIETAERYAALILANTENSDWALRYFAAQTYLELYGLTQEETHLTAAYEIALNNVNHLLEEQKKLNAAYLADIALIEAPKNITKEQKREIKAYNDMLKQVRRTELPPVCEPLLVNCELLFALMDRMNPSEKELGRIDEILHADGQPVFLCKPLDALYSFDEEPAAPADISFSKAGLIVPAEYVSDGTQILVTVSHNGESVPLEGWTLSEVKRTNKEDISSFQAVYVSENAKKFSFKPDMTIHIEIVPKAGCSLEPVVCDYKVVEIKHLWVIPDVAFEKAQ